MSALKSSFDLPRLSSFSHTTNHHPIAWSTVASRPSQNGRVGKIRQINGRPHSKIKQTPSPIGTAHSAQGFDSSRDPIRHSSRLFNSILLSANELAERPWGAFQPRLLTGPIRPPSIRNKSRAAHRAVRASARDQGNTQHRYVQARLALNSTALARASVSLSSLCPPAPAQPGASATQPQPLLGGSRVAACCWRWRARRSCGWGSNQPQYTSTHFMPSSSPPRLSHFLSCTAPSSEPSPTCPSELSAAILP